MAEIILRQATLDELHILLQFEQGIVDAERPYEPTFTDSEVHYYDLEAMISSEDTEVVVAEINGRIIGSGNARIRCGSSYNNFTRYAFLGFMYVLPAYRGLGVNQMIIEYLRQWAFKKGLNEVRLQVYSDNVPAVKSYEKAGFRKHVVEMRFSKEME